MLRPARLSLTARLTLLFAMVSTTVLLLLGLIVGTSVEHHFEDMDKGVLDRQLAMFEHMLESIHSTGELTALSQQVDSVFLASHGPGVLIRAPGGRLLFRVGNVGFPERLMSDPGTSVAMPVRWADTTGHEFRGISASVRTGIPDVPTAWIAVAIDIEHHEHFMHQFRMTLWTVVGVAAALSGFLGWLVARQGLAPLKMIRQKAADITAHHLDHRLAVGTIPIELAEVVETLDGMLERLQSSFLRLEDFSSDIAHELRTPVSNLLTQTQVTLSKSRSIAEYQDVLASNAEEFERLSRMIADMLFLAKSDNDLVIPFKEQVDLHREASDLLEFYEAVAEENGVRMSLEGEALVTGDRLMLRRAISNLLSNAIRHTPRDGTINVLINESGGTTVLVVTNTGETIPPEYLQRVFERFFRADSSRRQQADGTGLGLAITRSILRAHGGDVGVRSEGGETSFELRFQE